MITGAILKQMASENVAGLVMNKNFFWEEAPLQKDGSPAQGVWIITRGGTTAGGHNGLNQRTTADFYIAMSNKVKAEDTLNEIRKWLNQHQCICKLSGNIDGTNYEFTNVRIRQTTTPQTQGSTANGSIIKFASANIIFDQQ